MNPRRAHRFALNRLGFVHASATPAEERRSARTHLGLCSVTLRALPAAEVAVRAAEAGLEVVEWGADVHAPPDDPEALDRVAHLTADHGLRTCSYGSYWRAGEHRGAEFRAVAAAATTLGAPRVRIWAGAVGSAEADGDYWASVITATREAARIAADHGLQVAFEFHANTLADTPPTTLDLLARVDHPAVHTYWQPPVGMPEEEAVAGLRALGDHVVALHAFAWWPGVERHPLATRSDLWRAALGHVAGRGLDVLLEFVPDDDPELLTGEAATLRSLLGVTRR